VRDRAASDGGQLVDGSGTQMCVIDVSETAVVLVGKNPQGIRRDNLIAVAECSDDAKCIHESHSSQLFHAVRMHLGDDPFEAVTDFINIVHP